MRQLFNLARRFLVWTFFLPALVAQVGAQKKPSAPAARHDHPVIDINTAGAEDWKRLPGVGPELAREIVSFRSKHGPFRRIEDLLAIPRIGYKRWKGMRPYLKVGGDERKDESRNRASSREEHQAVTHPAKCSLPSPAGP
jgi:competence ComEA-like helix-hairpin-helix protein